MAAINWNDVVGTAAEVVVLPQLGQQVVLSVVNGAGLNVDNFGGEEADLTRTARILYAAHMATLILRKGLGPVASQSEGGASQSYWYGWMNPRALHATSYGILLWGIISGTPARAGGVFG